MIDSGEENDIEATTLNKIQEVSDEVTFGQDTLKMLQVFKKNQRQIVLSTESSKYSFLTYIKKISGNIFRLHNSIPPGLIKSVLDAQSSFLTLPKVTLIGERLGGDGKDIFFEIKEVKSLEETRGEERLSFHTDEKVYIEFVNPFDKQTKFKKRIFDISLSGLSFETHFDSSLLNSDEVIENIVIKIGDRDIKRCTGKVVYKKKLFDTEMRQRFQVGMRLENIEDLANGR